MQTLRVQTQGQALHLYQQLSVKFKEYVLEIQSQACVHKKPLHTLSHTVVHSFSSDMIHGSVVKTS